MNCRRNQSAYFSAILLSLLSLSLFSAGGSGFVLTYRFFLEQEVSSAFLLKLTIKFFSFGALAILLAALLRKRSPNLEDLGISLDTHKPVHISMVVFTVVLASLYAFTRLGKYPFPEPDEMHHLIVCRNISEYGAYASGHPKSGFIFFDSYDSVGPPVLLPCALSFIVCGVGLESARVVIGLYFVLFCLIASYVINRNLNPKFAVLLPFYLVFSLHSIYLARSLYGEVPAFLYLFLGIAVASKRSNNSDSWFLSFLAGVLFGLAVLCKTFLIVMTVPIFVAMLYDRCSQKTMSLKSLFWNGMGTLGVLLCWWLIQHTYGVSATNSQSMFDMYHGYFVFGLSPLKKNMTWFLARPALTMSWLLVLLLVTPLIFRKNYSFWMVVLYLTAVFFLMWWCFFTPGNIPRYLWYTSAILGMFSAIVVSNLTEGMCETFSLRRLRRYGEITLIAIISMPYAIQLWEQSERVFFADETADLRALTEFVNNLPSDSNLGTTFWPVERLVNFFSGREAVRLKGNDFVEKKIDVLVAHGTTIPPSLEHVPPDSVFGRFLLWSINP